jgi:digeranylgeranylglycerophospholipid reductase
VLEIFLGDVCEGGYGWVAPIKDRINVGVGKFLGLGGTSLPRALDKLLSMEFFNNKSIGLLEEEEASLLPVNLLKRFTYKNTIGIGDSVGQVNPLVGEGVRFILSSAELATVAIEKALQRSSHKYLLEYTSMWYKKYGKYYNRAELLQKVAKRSKFRSYWKFQLIYRVLKYNSPENLVKFFKGHTTSRLILKIFIRTISSIVIPRSFLKSSVEVSIKKA